MSFEQRSSIISLIFKGVLWLKKTKETWKQKDKLGGFYNGGNVRIIWCGLGKQ